MILTRDGKEITAIYRQDGSEVEEVKDANGRIVYSALREITGTLPLYFSGRGKPLTDYMIYGNAVQNGTPTSEAPVDATGCGVRTGNVMPAGGQKTVVSNGVTFSSDGNGRYRIHGTSTGYASARFYLASGFTVPISVSNNGQGTLSFFNTGANAKVMIVFYNGTTKVDDWLMSSQNRTSTAYNAIGNKYVNNVLITVSSGETVDMIITPEFTNDGVLPNEFEPYGYKLPLTVNGTEYPIYLGQVETTRRIKKLVLTGEENIGYESAYTRFSLKLPDCLIINVRRTPAFCTHYEVIDDGREISNVPDNSMYSHNTENRWYIKTIDYSTVDAFKSYLAAQYAAGTPVTVWYILATPETGTVNEPLMKIGDYADTISFAQAGVTIPTANGANVLDMTATVKPSEVYIKGKGIKQNGG